MQFGTLVDRRCRSDTRTHRHTHGDADQKAGHDSQTDSHFDALNHQRVEEGRDREHGDEDEKRFKGSSHPGAGACIPLLVSTSS